MLRQHGDESAHSTLDVLWVLYDRILRYDPKNPRSEDRDRFVLSKGHGPEALYAILAAKGFFPIASLKTFMAWESILGSHPDRNQVPGIEASTGSLGHGLSMAVGMALALRLKKSERRVFALIGDGECNEGSIWEAILLAGSRQLSNLTCIAMNNHSSSLELGDLAAKFAAFGGLPRRSMAAHMHKSMRHSREEMTHARWLLSQRSNSELSISLSAEGKMKT